MLKCIKMMLTLCPMKLRRKKYVEGNNVHFSTIKITLKKVRRSNVHFSTREITSKKVREINVDIWTIQITSKKYMETTWIFRRAKLHRKKVT